MEPPDLAQRLGSPLPNELVWFSHIVVPVVFFFVSALYVWDGVDLTWTFLAALWSMCLPFILVLLHCYVKRFKLGGMEGEMTSLPASDVGPTGRGMVMRLANERLPDQPSEDSMESSDQQESGRAVPREADNFEQLSPQARKVLRTLWTFQRMTFGPSDAQRRWGFGINPAAPDYGFFAAGSAELVIWGFVAQNEKAMVFLNNDGMDFCRQHEAWLLSGDVWSKFAPA
jgi:hypothetical protein